MFQNRKKIVRIIMAFLLCLGCLTGCTEDKTGETLDNESKKKRIVCTTFPQYDWVMQILGEKSTEYEVSYLTDNGADLHSYQVTTEDIAEIAMCDLFVYVGGESDAWVEEALQKSMNEQRKIINFIDVLGERVKEEEIVEGMEHDHEKEEEAEHEMDEHVWLSLKYAKVLVEHMTTAIADIDDENRSIYQKNCENYCKKLEVLNSEYEKVVTAASKKNVLFGDRFPFRYMMDDYAVEYFAAFPGCSAETEASFKTVVFLAQKADELELSTVLVIENSDKKLAQTIISNTEKKDQKILAMDSMQSVKKEDVESGTTYISIMQKNLTTLTEALQ